MIELAMTGMMMCTVVAQPIIETGERQCKFKCQDSTIVYVSTNKQYMCPSVIWEPLPDESLWKKPKQK